MQTELNVLEGKLTKLVQLSQHLRTENHRLRQALAAALSHSRQSDDKIEGARARIEHLLAQMPEEES
jgi:regulator of replication initiation timing